MLRDNFDRTILHILSGTNFLKYVFVNFFLFIFTDWGWNIIVRGQMSKGWPDLSEGIGQQTQIQMKDNLKQQIALIILIDKEIQIY